MSTEEVESFLCTQLAQLGPQSLGPRPAQAAVYGVIDSLQGLELTLAIENRYGIRFKDAELNSGLLRSIPRLAQLVASKVGNESRR